MCFYFFFLIILMKLFLKALNYSTLIHEHCFNYLLIIIIGPITSMVNLSMVMQMYNINTI